MRINANSRNKTKARGLKLKMLSNLPLSEESSVHQEGQMRIYKQEKRKHNVQVFAILKPIWRSKALRTSTQM